MRFRCLYLIHAIGLCLLSAGAHAEQWKPVEEHWYITELAGSPAGYMRITQEDDGARYRVSTAQELHLNRGAMTLEVAMSSTFIETHAGKPLEMRTSNNMSQQVVHTTYVFGADDVQMTTTQGGRTLTKTMPLPTGRWLTPMAADRYVQERRSAGAEKIVYRAILPESGVEPATITSIRVGKDVFQHDGREIPVTIWDSTNTVMPGVTAREVISSEGVMMETTMNVAMPMRTYLATEAQAKAVLAGDRVLPELMFTLFVKPDRPVARIMDAKRLVMRVRSKQGDPPDLPTAGAQRAERIAEDDAVRITIDMTHNQSAADATDTTEYTEPSAMVDSSHPLVKKLAERATEDAGEDAAARAEAMRVFVHRYIREKGLATAFASASETAQMRTGDCSEHGVLLAAMLRAQGIPSRIAGGLLYVDEFGEASDSFGWHMWTQALIDGRWVDYDATLPQRYHVGHILTSAESLADGAAAQSLNAMVRLIGNLDIEIIDVSYD